MNQAKSLWDLLWIQENILRQKTYKRIVIHRNTVENMQRLTYVKTQDGFELYCEMCDSLYSKEFVNSDTKHFMDIHRHIHNRLGLDTPDFEENEELSTDLSTDIF